ncbi:unnamed protein product [Toxocara canis]|uniref:Uncharacterized protein n=1 Tax=Toxocara canis TaxID=6265 RepID=A0A183UGA9_TOXCA|nr:unnamed protein product [Toxocara canis]
MECKIRTADIGNIEHVEHWPIRRPQRPQQLTTATKQYGVVLSDMLCSGSAEGFRSHHLGLSFLDDDDGIRLGFPGFHRCRSFAATPAEVTD